ncbi:ATP-dependent Clp protease proteolytic subunit 2 [compost metagenome]
MGPEEKRPYMMYESANVARNVDIYISDEFAEPLLYCEMIHVIRTASPNDTISIHLNTPGGRLDTGVQLISAIRSSEARIVTILDGVAHSMGALLFLCGHEMIIHDHAQLMFHTYSGGVFGKGSDIRGQTDATEDWFRIIANDICYPFMTKKEIQRMLKGEDFWFQTEQIETRLTKMGEILAAEINQMIAILAERGLMVVDADEIEDDLIDEIAQEFHEALESDTGPEEVVVAKPPKKPRKVKVKPEVAPEVKTDVVITKDAIAITTLGEVKFDGATIHDDESIQ